MRAQAALEFSMMLMITMLIMSVVLIVVAYYTVQVSRARAEAQMNELADQIQQELLMAAAVPDGYLRNFTLPSKVGSFDYDIEVSNGIFTLTLSNDLVASRIIPQISGSLSQGTNYLSKEDGSITVSS